MHCIDRTLKRNVELNQFSGFTLVFGLKVVVGKRKRVIRSSKNAIMMNNFLKHMKKRLVVFLKSEINLADLYLDLMYNHNFMPKVKIL